MIDEKRLQNLATAYPADPATIERSRMAAELLAARRVVEAARNEDARERCQCGQSGCIYEAADAALDAALAAYDEATS
jgi:hypothetical protein